jgi:hypothetical protein
MALDISFDWANLRYLGNILDAQDADAKQVYTLPAFSTLVCGAFNVRMP